VPHYIAVLSATLSLYPSRFRILSVVAYNTLLRRFLINNITLRFSQSHLYLPMTSTDFSGIRVLVFDVIGTTTDWHSPVQQALEVAAAKTTGPPPHDWSKFAHEWRQG